MGQSRKEIRDKVRELLLNQTDAGTNVYVNRETALWQGELPAILISDGIENATPRTLQARTYLRTFELIIEVKVAANDTVDDDLDAIAEDIEAILLANPNLAATCISTIYKSAEPTLEGEGETETGVLKLTYEVQYQK